MDLIKKYNENPVRKIEKEYNLNKFQKEALRTFYSAIKNGNNCTIVGMRGRGKTFLIEAIAEAEGLPLAVGGDMITRRRRKENPNREYIITGTSSRGKRAHTILCDDIDGEDTEILHSDYACANVVGFIL